MADSWRRPGSMFKNPSLGKEPQVLFLNLLPDVKYLLVFHVFLFWLMIIFIPHQEPSRRSWEPLSLWDAPSMAAIPMMSSMTSTAAKLSAHLSEQDTVPKK